MIHTPSYLQKRNGLYYFRMRVPDAVRATHGPEIRVSLRTGNKTEAALLSRVLAVRYHAHFAKEPALKMATTRLPKDVGQLIFETPQGTLRTENNTPEEYAQFQEAIKALSSNQQQFFVAQVASAPLAPAQTGKLLSQAIEEFLAKMMPRDATGEISKEDCEDGWKTAKAQIERPSQLDALLTILGDQPISAITFDLIQKSKEQLLKLPPGWRKSKEWRSKSVGEIITVQNERIEKYKKEAAKLPKSERFKVSRNEYVKEIDVSTANNYLWTWSDFFKWSKRQRYTLEDFADDLAQEHRNKKDSFRRSFKPDELKKLFEADYYSRAQYDDPYKYWVPMLLLYTGGRLNEFCQLLVEDIVTVDDIPCFLIWDDEVHRQRLKGESSRRRIPIHSKLIEAGFLEFVESMRQSKSVKLFPKLDNGSEKHNKLAGNWLNRHMTAEGVKDGRGLDCHSFRHTAIGFWKNANVDERWAAAICGQRYTDDDDNTDKKKAPAITFGTYGGLLEPSKLQPYVEMLDFGINHPAFKMPQERRTLIRRKPKLSNR